MVPMPQHLLDACRTLKEDCEYTAQAHFILAERAGRRALYLVFIPAVLAGLVGMIIALGAPVWLGTIVAVANAIAAIASYIGIDRKATDHRSAATLYTQLKNDARALEEIDAPDMSAVEVRAEVRRLRDRYALLVQTTPPTDSSSFEAARKLIKDGRMTPDFREGRKESPPTDLSDAAAPAPIPSEASPDSVRVDLDPAAVLHNTPPADEPTPASRGANGDAEKERKSR